MKTVLVTGSLGLTGSAVVDTFLSKGWKVVGVDGNFRAMFFGTAAQENDRDIEFYNIDLRNDEEMRSLFEKYTFDAIVHTAAQPSHDFATNHIILDFEINALATIKLLMLAKEFCFHAPFIHLSTDKVYGENMSTHLVEKETRYDAPDLPLGFDESLGLDFARDRSFFGCSKVAADVYAQQFAQKFGMRVIIFRPGCITGRKHQGAPQHGFLSYLAKCVKERTPYHVHGNGKQVRDNIHASDLAEAIYATVQAPTVGAVYNIGGGPERAVSLIEAASLLQEHTGNTARVIFDESHREGDRLWDIHNVSKFRTAYPSWDYKYSLQDIIEDLV